DSAHFITAFSFYRYVTHLYLPSFPTRRSSDLRHREHLESHTHRRRPCDGGGGGGRVRDLSRERVLHGDDPEHGAPRRRLSTGRVRRQASDHWRLRQLPRDDTHVRNRSAPHSPEALESHSHNRRVCAVPHDDGQLRGLLRHRYSPGCDRVSELPWPDGRAVRHRDPPRHPP